MNVWKRILVIAPHADDAEANCGGLIHRAFREGIDCRVLTLCEMRLGEAEEAKRAMEALGSRECPIARVNAEASPDLEFADHRTEVRAAIRDTVTRFDPCVLVYPADGDYHEDHAVVREIAQTFIGEGKSGLAFRSVNRGALPRPNFFVSLREEDVQAKVRALGVYSIAEGRPWASPPAVYATAQHCGIAIRASFAEVYIAERIAV